MRSVILAVAGSCMLLSSGAGAQDSRDAASPAKAPCPTKSDQRAALQDPKTPGPNNPDAAMGVEKSAILPSAPGDTKTAAATVQQKGEAIASPLDCELVPGHVNSLDKQPK